MRRPLRFAQGNNLSVLSALSDFSVLYRGARIRTGDLLLPKQALYQAKLRPAAEQST